MGEMSILDDAIREHLELKRAHGADEAELKRLEDEAFGPAERPDQAGQQVDPFAEAPTEFLAMDLHIDIGMPGQCFCRGPDQIVVDCRLAAKHEVGRFAHGQQIIDGR